MNRIVCSLLISILLIAAVGCSSIQPARKTVEKAGVKLNVMPQAEGFSLSWPSEPDKIYTVIYSDSLASPDWKPLAGSVNLRGTGEIMSIQDATITNESRFYRLKLEPVTK